MVRERCQSDRARQQQCTKSLVSRCHGHAKGSAICRRRGAALHLIGGSLIWISLAVPALRPLREPSSAAIDCLFVATLLYLPLLLGLMVADVRL